MTVSLNPLDYQSGGRFVIKVTGANNTDNAGLGQVLNPEGQDLLITRTYWYIKTASTGAATVSSGVAASGAAATDIVNALAANGAIAGKVYNGATFQTTAKTEISAPAKWEAAKYITFTGSADTSGLVAYLYVEYMRLP
jgi:hypothetical protein